jgi:hypothetical protein
MANVSLDELLHVTRRVIEQLSNLRMSVWLSLIIFRDHVFSSGWVSKLPSSSAATTHRLRHAVWYLYEVMLHGCAYSLEMFLGFLKMPPPPHDENRCDLYFAFLFMWLCSSTVSSCMSEPSTRGRHFGGMGPDEWVGGGGECESRPR